MTTRDPHLAAARYVRDNGGELVGRTRLQKVAYLTQLAGLAPQEFDFEYKQFGPYSQDLATGMEIATALEVVTEVERPTSWGGFYSTFRAPRDPAAPVSADRERFVQLAARMDPVEIELAATAAFLFVRKGIAEPWHETALHKPAKAEAGRLEKAKKAYTTLRSATGDRLPALPQG